MLLLLFLATHSPLLFYFLQIMAAAAAKSDEDPQEFDNVPPEFRCCITHDIMQEPVMTDDGETYEKYAITVRDLCTIICNAAMPPRG